MANPRTAPSIRTPARRSRVAGCLCLAALILAGCAPGEAGKAGSGNQAPLSLGISDTDPRFIHTNRAPGDASMQALLEGTLVVGPGNCLGVATAEGITVIPAFPKTAMLFGDGRDGIDVLGRRYLLGQEVSFGGGLSGVADADRRAIAPCTAEGDVFLIQSLTD